MTSKVEKKKGLSDYKNSAIKDLQWPINCVKHNKK